MPQVDFYILAGDTPATRLRFACRLAEKAWLGGERVLLRVQDARELESLDALLWTFAEQSFLPHEPLGSEAVPGTAPVLLTAGALPGSLAQFGLLVDLATGLPAVPAEGAPPQRIVEIVDADGERRRLARERFRGYRERGWAPTTHNIDQGTDAANG